MKIFLAGAVSCANEQQLEKYTIYKNALMNEIENVKLITPDDIWAYRQKCEKENLDFDKIKIDELMVEYDLMCVRESDLIICDLSELSTGMGIVLGVAHENKKPIIFLYKKGSYISNMITGAFPDAHFIIYSTHEDLKRNIINMLSPYTK